MSLLPHEAPQDQVDPRYREGMAHLQAGRWKEAIRCFEDLLREYPNSQPAQEALGEARFKAGIDSKSRVRAKRWIVPWRAIILRLLVVILIVVAAFTVFRLVNRQFAPALARAEATRQQNQLLADGKARLEAGELDAAEARFTELLAMVPDQKEALAGLAQIKSGRELDALYQQGVTAQEAGQLDNALKTFTDLTVKSPTFRDVSLRIAAIKKQQDLDQLFAGAEADYQAGRDTDALAKYEQIRGLNESFQRELIAGRMFDLYMQMGTGLIEQDNPAPEDVITANELFGKALALQPRNAQALLERSLAETYIAAQSDYSAGNWDRAATQFEALYTQRPDYLGGAVIGPLYDAYIRNGDAYGASGDCGLAYDQYRKANGLPVADRSLAAARLEATRPCLTPTPTPSNTPTPTLIPTATPYIPPTPVPSTTPPPPLSTFRNQIVFRADKPDAPPGLWVMNPDGTNVRYLGESSALEKQYEDLLVQETLSPDGRYHVYVQTAAGEQAPEIFIQGFVKDQFGNLPTKQLTHLAGLNYDPVWSPDGSRIAFVSTDRGSDDIWVINADGTNPWNNTPNKWEWDKHPSWSPDSQKIVFWTNREGTKQIYVMDASGRNQKKINATTWDQYDPIWIR
jgi:outer membrane protein assembly factor BamD (BamD/ComL family)